MHKYLIQLIEYENINLIKSVNKNRVNLIESKTQLKFPSLYRQLYENYECDSFIIGEIDFFGNTEFNDDNELNKKIFNDKYLVQSLIENGFLQFARPECGSYDPICFNTNNIKGHDCEIVRICHETILINRTIKIVKVIAPSFKKWIESSIIFEKQFP